MQSAHVVAEDPPDFRQLLLQGDRDVPGPVTFAGHLDEPRSLKHCRDDQGDTLVGHAEGAGDVEAVVGVPFADTKRGHEIVTGYASPVSR